MDTAAAISTLESAIGDPRRGLPLDIFHFISRVAPLINVDLLIQDAGRTLLTWRDDEFFGAGWHVPGGIIRYKEKAADRVRACALEELGVDIAFDAEPMLVSEFIREQSDRGHFISLLYRCRLLTPLDEVRRATSNAPSAGEWRWHEGCPPDLLEVHACYARFF
jgi:colanic acid biosynthesis protein WcaH